VCVCVCVCVCRCITVLSAGAYGLDLTAAAKQLFDLVDYDHFAADIVPQELPQRFYEKIGLDRDVFDKIHDEVRVCWGPGGVSACCPLLMICRPCC
jgi:hypothetical protein